MNKIYIPFEYIPLLSENFFGIQPSMKPKRRHYITETWKQGSVLTKTKIGRKEEGGIRMLSHLRAKKNNHQNRDSEASTLRRWSMKSEVLIPKQKFKLFKCAVGEGDIFGIFFFIKRILMSLHGSWNHAQQDLKWHGGINECCVHVGKTHNLERPVINWEAESSLARKGP